MRKRWLAIIFVMVILSGGYVLYQTQFVSGNNKIETETAKTMDVSEQVTSSGKTKALKQVDLHFQTYGRLAWIGVKEGDLVSEYQTIATLDKQELEKNFQKALRDYSKERNDFEEDKRDTYKDQPVTDTIKRILEKNQWDLEKAVMDVEIKDITLKWSTLTTPIAGIVTHIDTPVAGVNILATDTFTVADLQSVVFSANIDETDVGKITIGQKAEVNLDAYPDKKFTGTVSKVAFAAEISSAGATIFPIEIILTDATNLLIGLNGDVNIIIKETPQAISVPNDAVRENEDTKYVIIKTGNKYEKAFVKTGIVGQDYTQVLSGLDINAPVVIRGFEYLPIDLLK